MRAARFYLGGEPNPANPANFIATTPEIQHQVKQLATSPHPWIREAARKVTE